MRIWYGSGTQKSGEKHWNIGVHVYQHDELDFKQVVRELDNYLHERYPNTEIKRARSVRVLLGDNR